MRSGAFSNLVARTETAELTNEDGRFARRAAFATLRNLLRIDRALAAVSARPLEKIEPVVLDPLRVAATEILFGASAEHAAVDTNVEVIRINRPAAVSFANAVLRRLTTEGEPALPAGDEGVALQLGQPLWLYRLMASAWGGGEAADFFRASQLPAARTGRRRDGLGLHRAFPGIPGACYLEEGPLPGDLVIQDPASIAVGLAVAAETDDRVLDMAAAPGGKTLHIADQLGGSGLLVAADRHPGRLRRTRGRLAEYGAAVQWCVADATRAPFPDGTFDRVLVDAPCTNLGTLRRRPEVRFRLRPGDPAQLAAGQRSMVREALRVTRPGGIVVYSVCTVTPEETVGVIAGFETQPLSDLPGRRWDGGLLMAPHLTQTDGMFIARLLR